MTDAVASQAASMQITPYVDKFFIQHDSNVDGQLSFQEFVNGQDLPPGKDDPANAATSASSSSTIDSASSLSSAIASMQSTLIQLQELLAEPSSTPNDVPSIQVSSPPQSNANVGSPAASTPPDVVPIDSDKARLFTQIDVNGDGNISYVEMQNFAVDQIASGKETLQQVTTLLDGLGSAAQTSDDFSPTPSSDQTSQSVIAAAQSSSGPTEDAKEALFKQIDADQNGSVSRQEMEGFVTNQIFKANTELSLVAQLFGGNSSS